MRDGSNVPKMCLYKHTINKLFNPTNETNADTYIYIPDIFSKLWAALLKELKDPKKITYAHLSSMNGELS